MTTMKRAMTPMKIFISAVALLLLGFVVAGFLLSGEWQASRSVELAAPPEAVFPLVNEPRGWDRWTPWDHVEDTLSGPEAGPGATRRWDDPQWGQGRWTLTESDPPRRVTYEVEVEDGALVTRGEVVLEPLDGGRTLLTWSEAGDFGWNPLLAFMALGMDRMQGEEMEKNLARLDSLVDAGCADGGC